jgi:chemotaxis protein MotB
VTFRLFSPFRVATLVPLLVALGCGHSEDEWQAQLAKYGELQQKHSSLEAELAAQKGRVAELNAQLEQMGVKLSSEGTEKEKLNQDLAQMKAALAEYQARAEMLERIKQRFELLRDKLKKLTELGLKVEIRRNRMVIRLPGDVLFASGDDKLSPDGNQVLAAVADVIRNDKPLSGRYFQVAGHTDNKPLKGGRFGDNWGLAAMRARQVLLYLVAPLGPRGGGLNPERLHMAGYGDTDPVVKNETDEGRKQNRRVELVLLPDIEEMLDLRSLI